MPGPSFRVRLTFSDGADVDVTAVVSHGRVTIEDLHAQPPLSPDDFAALVDWIERPLADDAPRAVEPGRRA
ncbi:M20 family metallopeptidase, partial [Streptomyces sp. SID10115]|nr:M20 family metallopeptidase [Streptomyces sp. SID10115]